MESLTANHQAKSFRLLRDLLLLSAMFFVWEIIFVLVFSANSGLLSLLLNKHFHLPISAMMGEVFFWFVQISLYLVLSFCIWIVTLLFSFCFRMSWKKTNYIGYLVWVVVILSILLANQIVIPASRFSELMNAVLPLLLSKIILYVCLAFLLMILLGAAFGFIKLLIRSNIVLIATLFLIIVGGFIFWHLSQPVKQLSSSKVKQPNVIIIGLDALRPDYVHAYQKQFNLTPHLDDFLSQATSFNESLTPMGRTFVAWSSILTGQYPKNTGIRFNLEDPRYFNLNNTLPMLLQQKGYHTIYATDDVRFSNITKRFGFDELIGIHPGVNDFVLGTINDFPLSNLLVNSKIGRYIFPYSYANRAATITYDPNSFLALLQNKLSKRPQKPLFLCVHFCLTHWPYTWESITNTSNEPNIDLYKQSIKRADLQFAQFMNILRKNHLLNNTIVIVISDHGEAFGLPGDRLISKKKYIPGLTRHFNLFKKLNAMHNKTDQLNVSIGHGTDALSWTQHHNVLAFRYYGNFYNVPHHVNGLVSLIDIKPTVLDILNLPSPNTDGISLKQYLVSTKSIVPNRMIFVETGLTPKAVRSKNISIKDVLKESVRVFHIDPKTSRIVLNHSAMSRLLSLKERAVYFGNWVLAFYPFGRDKMIPILVNRQSGLWTDDMSDHFAKRSISRELLKRLKRFYGTEIRD